MGLIGAGYISAFHAAALRRIPNVTLAGIVDTDAVRAEHAAKTFGTRAFPDIRQLVYEGVDVVHVLTPPETHADVTLQALELGAHVLVEKPLATNVEDCGRIAASSRARGLRVCVDHSLLYDIQIRRAIESVRAGRIGRLVSVHILRTADYPPYEGGALPPQYRSAGYPFRDLGVHQLYVLQELLGPIEDIRASWNSIGGDPNLTFDEWRAEVFCRDGVGNINISFNARPIQNVLILQGTDGVMCVDQMRMFTTKRGVTPLPKAVERVLNAYTESLQTMVQVAQGSAGFVTRKVRQFHGLQELVAEFYRSLDRNLPVPVSIEDATPIVEWVERVARAADADAASRAAALPALRPQIAILVTGARGALGSAVVERLQQQGESVRVFVRRRTADLPEGIEVATGDLGDPAAVDAAVRGARIVIHVGAATKGGWPMHRAGTVAGTQNIIDACLRHGAEQLIYISSLSVVRWAGARNGEPLTESSPLEPNPEARGAYTRAKLEAELLIRKAVEERGLPAVILRPGQIFGGKLPLVNPAVARKVGRNHLVLGDGTLRLPLVYIDDVVDAICSAMEKRLVNGEIIQLVDAVLPTQNDILARAHPRSRIVRVPVWLVFAGGWASEVLFKAMKRSSPLSRYRLRSALSHRKFVSENAEEMLQWRPRTGVMQGIERQTREHRT